MRYENKKLAETEGFEPSVAVRLRTLSRGVVSANSPTSPSVFAGGNYALWKLKNS